MKYKTLAALVLGALIMNRDVSAQSGSTGSAPPGPFARISVLHPIDGRTTEFEAGYLRHLAWHQQAGDKWTWYGWKVTFGERQRWFVYATFGHSGASLDAPVPGAEDERDNVLNVAPHVDSWANALYEFLPGLSRGAASPSPTLRLELTTVDLVANGAAQFETAIAARRASLRDETLWYRLIAGGPSPRYVRLRPQPTFAAILDRRSEQALPESVSSLIVKTAVEILTLHPTLSLGLEPSTRR